MNKCLLVACQCQTFEILLYNACTLHLSLAYTYLYIQYTVPLSRLSGLVAKKDSLFAMANLHLY